MTGWHHWLDGRESEWTPGDGDGQGGLVCCDSWGCKESDMTERPNWTEFCPGSYSRMTAISEDEGLSVDTDSISAIISYYSSITLRSKCLLFINHPVWYAVMIAGMAREIYLLIVFFLFVCFKCIIWAPSKLLFPRWFSFVLITNSFQIYVT